jgi:xanthine dehydrogenase accessory factor
MRSQIYHQLRSSLEREKLVALASVVGGSQGFLGRQLLIWADGSVAGDLGATELDTAARSRAVSAFASFASERFHVDVKGEPVDVFLEVHPPRRKLVVVGAVHVAMPLVTFAKELGFRTFVVDPRTAFATPERFAHVDELLTLWPDEALKKIGLDESTYVTLLSHDLKLDIPALVATLRSPVRYIGALGSRKTHQKRLLALTEAGFSAAELATIHNPIGFDLGGRRAEEMAVAIVAEMVAVSHGKGLKRGG